MFITLSRECVGSHFYPYKRKDNMQLSDDLIQNVLLTILSQISNN